MLEVVGNNVAMTPIFDPDISKGGLYIPEMAKERCDQGIIKYIGPKVKWAKPGDYCLFSGYSGTYVDVENEGRLILMPENFLICKLHAEPTEVPGVYFRGRDGDYFPATYEMTMELIAEAFHEAPWFRQRKDIATTKNKSAYAHSERFTFTGHKDDQLDPNKEVGEDD
jgi:co-chaperonin GroES (HSP10)